MAFFKFPWLGRAAPDDKPGRRSRVPQAESIEVMRRRARHRLIGAAVLVGVGVVGFPMLFDTQPRPIPADIPIEIPDRNKMAPLPLPATTAGTSPAPAGGASTAPAVAPPSGKAVVPSTSSVPGVLEGEEVVPTKPVVKPAQAPAVASSGASAREPSRAPAPAAAEAPRPPRPDDGQRARALLEGRGPDGSSAASSPVAVAEEGRFVVQVGAFGDADKVREVRAKLERAGLKTYTHAIDTKDGKRIRVRVGPFSSRADAERAAMRVKGMDLPASVLTL